MQFWLSLDRCEVVETTSQWFNVRKFCIDVEQVPLDSARHAISDTFPYSDRPEAFGKPVTQRRTYTCRGGDTGHEYGVYTGCAKEPGEGKSHGTHSRAS